MIKQTVYTEENWHSAFNYEPCDHCGGDGCIECELCGKNGTTCECTTVPRTFKVCQMCDGEGNFLLISKKELQ